MAQRISRIRDPELGDLGVGLPQEVVPNCVANVDVNATVHTAGRNDSALFQGVGVGAERRGVGGGSDA